MMPGSISVIRSICSARRGDPRESRADADAVQAAFDLDTHHGRGGNDATPMPTSAPTTASLRWRRTLRIQEQTFDLDAPAARRRTRRGSTQGRRGRCWNRRATLPTLKAQRAGATAPAADRQAAPPKRRRPRCNAKHRLNCPIRSVTARCCSPVARIFAGPGAPARRVSGARQCCDRRSYPSISIGGSVDQLPTRRRGRASPIASAFDLGRRICGAPNIAVASAAEAGEAGADAALAIFDGTARRRWNCCSPTMPANSTGLRRRRGGDEARGGADRAASLSGWRENFQVVLDAERLLAQIQASIAQFEQQRRPIWSRCSSRWAAAGGDAAA